MAAAGRARSLLGQSSVSTMNPIFGIVALSRSGSISWYSSDPKAACAASTDAKRRTTVSFPAGVPSGGPLATSLDSFAGSMSTQEYVLKSIHRQV